MHAPGDRDVYAVRCTSHFLQYRIRTQVFSCKLLGRGIGTKVVGFQPYLIPYSEFQVLALSISILLINLLSLLNGKLATSMDFMDMLESLREGSNLFR